MCFSIAKPARPPGLYRRLALLALALTAMPTWAELQAGRDSQGRLWITDQGLPAGSKPLPSPTIGVTTRPEGAARQTNPAPLAPPAPKTDRADQDKDKATCNGIDQRYEETRSNLARIEQDKASGKLLIPDSGLNSLRQNLSTLERLRTLCR